MARSLASNPTLPEQSSVCLVVALRPTGGSVLKHRSGGALRARRPSAVQSSPRSNRADHATDRVGATRPNPHNDSPPCRGVRALTPSANQHPSAEVTQASDVGVRSVMSTCGVKGRN